MERQIREYHLGGGPEKVDLRVSVPRLRAGSHSSNDLVLKHASVSRFHLEIEARADGFRIRDLDSTNGTRVDGLRIKEAYLPPRALLRLGQVSLAFSVTGACAALPRSESPEFFGVLGGSVAMRELFATLERAAPTDATVLLEGESGTGKERVASAIHRASRRAAGPFVVLDCAAVPLSLMESELFGHERGAFTGAVARREGRLVEADGGTLFLDEIGELPLEVQPKLLRVLEQKEVRPLGSTASRTVDVRLVAATNRNLAREVNRGTFREDLYYRLAVVQVAIPPLRERCEDIRLLVEHFVHQALPGEAGRAREILRGVSTENWRKLERLPWPGNVRELRNFIERTLVLSGGPIESQHLPSPNPLADASTDATVDLDRPFTTLKSEIVAHFERAYLLGQLGRHGGNVSAAARASGLDRMNFKRLLQRYR
jgi:DNA-binding NtrC family response regulator